MPLEKVFLLNYTAEMLDRLLVMTFSIVLYSNVKVTPCPIGCHLCLDALFSFFLPFTVNLWKVAHRWLTTIIILDGTEVYVSLLESLTSHRFYKFSIVIDARHWKRTLGFAIT